VSSGSVFSTILINRVVEAHATRGARFVVDVGCGGSPYRDLLTPERYVGVDRALRPSAIDGAYVVGDVVALPIASASCDGVLCTEVIEHVVDERALAAELARVAQPGAVLVLSSPFVHGLHEQPYDFRRLTSIGLRTVLEDAGWVVEVMATVGGPVVVGVDSAVRSIDSGARRVVRRLLGTRFGLLDLMARVSARIQQALALIALLSPVGQFGPIDPGEPTPRLTLGYVVIGRRAR
jgi:SAM-dependent methyltransferase